MSTDKPRRLGRGLEALLATKAAPTAQPAERGAFQRILIAEIRPNPYQPRKEFSTEELAELEASLKASGLLQPITVRPSPTGSGYELVAGERRLRAATRLGWPDIPAVVKEVDDRALLTLALVENLQRANLNPIEEAEGYQRLIQEFELTQQQVADVIGKDRSTVANVLRLLQLPASVRRMLQEGQLTLGHARALLALGNERLIVDVAREVVVKGLTVRHVEQRARLNTPEAERRRAKAPPAGVGTSRNPEARRIEDELRRHLQTDVAITVGQGERGKIEITFYTNDDLDRLLELILGYKRERL
jgi:ParB family transcriptional regulator, chromosome partitioning protein